MALGDITDPVLWKQGDTRPVLRYQPKQGSPPQNIAMTGATVVFSLRQVAVTGTAPAVAPGAPGAIVISRGAATVSDQTNGILQYTPTTAATANNGYHQAEFEVTFADGGVMTFPPGNQYIYILVGDDIS